jgi:Tfp pilus assembly protein PilF
LFINGIAIDRGKEKKPRKIAEMEDCFGEAGVPVRVTNSRSQGPQQFVRPLFTADPQLFSNLVAYAPGMNTGAADIQTVLESEAVPNLAHLPGRIDPAARALIDKARTAGWQTLKVGEVAFTFDGSGRYAYETVSSLGLHEQVACDGKTLLHLYPELGIGARRTFSRFHRAEIAGLVPWVLPPAEDLAHGADVLSVDAHSLAVSPRDADKAKDADGNPVPYLREVLVFAEEGRLAERRLVLMPENKTLLREVYGAREIELFDNEDKACAKRKLELTETRAPELHPDTSALVVLPLPLRSRDHVYRSLGFDPSRSINPLWLICAAQTEPESVMQLFASEIGSHNGPGARAIFNLGYKVAGNRKLGFYTLLTSIGENVSNDPDLLAGRERDPLANYLALEGNGVYHALQRRFSLDLGSDVTAEDTFLGKLARMRDRLVCLNADTNNRSWLWRKAEQDRGYEFVRRNKTNVLGLSLLTYLQQRALYDNPENQRKLAESWKLLAEQPGLRYIARFEEVRALANGDRRAEARKKFRELYEETIKNGALPPLDGTFRWALQSDGKDSDEWTALLRETASRFVAEKHRPAAVALAWQCWQLGDQPLAQNLLSLALDGMKEDEERLITTLSAVQFLFQTNQYAQADSLMQGLLDNADFAKSPWLWRLAERIASQRGMADRAIAYLENALDLEYHAMPEVINLQEVRNDYGRLLNHYQSVARSAATLKVDAPADLLAKTIRIADRWRALDRDGGAAASAAEVLRLLGAKEMAWEYQTTPLATQPKQVGPWLNLAQTLNREGEFGLADRAYATALETQPDNPQILWDRARNLQQAGSNAEARKLLLQLADGDWKAEYRWMKDQARWQAGDKYFRDWFTTSLKRKRSRPSLALQACDRRRG